MRFNDQTKIRQKTLRTENKYGAKWVCSDPGPNGHPKCKKGCGYTNGEWTNRVDGNRKDQWKTACKNCPKKTSLNKSKITDHYFTRPDLIDAVREANKDFNGGL